MNMGLPEVAVKISGSFKLADPFLIKTWGPIEVDNVDVLIGQDGAEHHASTTHLTKPRTMLCVLVLRE